MDIFEFNKRVQRIDSDVLINETFDEIKWDIVKLNQEQLLAGKTTKGTKIEPKYKTEKSDRYSRQKHIQNPAPGMGVPDLFKTGEWFKKFFAIMENYIWEVSSFSRLTQILANKYNDIFGLSKKDSNAT